MTRLLALVLLLAGASTAPAAAQDCAERTARSSSVLFLAESVGLMPNDVVTVRSHRSGECYGRTTVPAGNFALAVWEDNPITPEKDGAREYELLAYHVERDGREPFGRSLLGTFEPDGVSFVHSAAGDSVAAAVAELESFVDELAAERDGLRGQVADLERNLAAITEASAERIGAYQDSLATERSYTAALEDTVAAKNARIAELEALVAAGPGQDAIDEAVADALAAYEDEITAELRAFLERKRAEIQPGQ